MGAAKTLLETLVLKDTLFNGRASLTRGVTVLKEQEYLQDPEMKRPIVLMRNSKETNETKEGE